MRAEQLIGEHPELELLSPAQLGIVCFRRRFAGAAEEEWQSARLNAALVGRFEQSGLGLVSSTTLDGRYAIRLCILNHTTTEADVERTIDWFARLAGAIAVGPVGPDRAVGRGPRGDRERRMERR